MRSDCLYCGGRLYQYGNVEWHGMGCPRCKVLWSSLHGLFIQDEEWPGAWKPAHEGLLIVAGEREEARAIGCSRDK
jgi:phage FluMu protein Com